MIRLSIIVLSYNTKNTTLECLGALYESLLQTSLTSEIIVVDNASEDGSGAALLTYSEHKATQSLSLRVILNRENVGFTRGNNQALKLASGTYVLYLNSDVLIQSVDWEAVLSYMDTHHDIGALTIPLYLRNKSIDLASHRGFPTIWNSLTYLSKLEALTASLPLLNRVFGGYHLSYKRLNTTHEIDSPSGAFFLARKSVLDHLKGFDEEYFMYGEDLDLAYRIKKEQLKIVYYAAGSALHLKYQSGISHTSSASRIHTKRTFYAAMKIFYKKHYAALHSIWVNRLVYFGIDCVSYLSNYYGR